ncbi:triple tyrosine motif-containing protein [Croceitalea sp. MTPC9]|uniref:helix-turn-helix and ligand-binding sensor domain-containing protein n=1 Tax=unclassified Croceitalea TaxID=2632280 RepID=UPI002B3C2474|nr:triple tyrosine motif-containing protein [Croceitalea sp. MTPC6]GMN18111.1 triple tyrosine motif-containing protein [Croceitalea sp. MTPC9]
MHNFFKILILFYGLSAISQELPPIQNFAPVDYNGENQNWDISQSSSKLIYVANNKGLLEYNGANWKIYPTPNESIMRSVNVIGERIYTGCYMEFGYWEKDSLNVLSYTSLSKKIKIPLVEDEEFWNIIKLGDLMVFQSKKRIYIFNVVDETVNTIDSQNTIPKIFKVNETIYFQRIGEGLYKIEYGEDTLVNNDEIIESDEIINIFKHDGGLRILTQNEGFYDFRDGSLNQSDIDSNEFLSTLSFYDATRLKDGRFVLGTISNGIVCLSKQGELESQINQNNGLSNNTVLSVFEDVQNNIWLGLDNGISYINTNAPYNVFNDNKGILGSVYTALVNDDKLYLGTNQGLFYKEFESAETFKFINGTQGQVWSLKNIDGTIFCGHHSGTLIVQDGSVEKIANVPGTWGVSKLENNPGLLIQGNYNGLHILEKNNDSWQLRNKIAGFNNSSRYFETLGQTIFVNHEYNGVFELTVDSNFYKVEKFEEDTSIRGANSGIINYKGDILYAYKSGVFKYEVGENKFVRDTLLSSMYTEDDYESGKLIFNENDNILWVFTKSGIRFLEYETLTNTPQLETIPLTKEVRNGILGYENILSLGNNEYLMGTTSGYITARLDDLLIEDFKVNIDRVFVTNYEDEGHMMDKSNKGYLRTHENNLDISFYTPEYNKLLNTQYQFQLLGIYDDWSQWSTASNTTFENLSYGSYIFNVRAKIGNKVSSNIATHSFQIAKPWYISNVMIVLYFLTMVLFSFMMHNLYKSYYKKQREKLIYKNKQELALAQVHGEKEIIRIKNEQLKTEFKNKSKELAASTMSIIKKNELLTNIKDELNQVNDKNSVRSVIKIIDKNLKKNDDWELFQEAFNNADSEFLKKVKTLHPSVSPNDLKLCAYLRLNLSSKEIAQLLHISPRSVEIKRYRLRKKLNLKYGDNLVNYILEL